MSGNWNSWDVPVQRWRTDVTPNKINNPNNMRAPPYGCNSVISTPIGRIPAQPPPLPPRQTATTTYNTYNHPGSFYNNFSFGGYGYGSGFRPGFGSFGYGYGGGYYGANNPESRFIQLAQESSKPAFDAIQSVLQTFSSVATMFDSIFNALYSSYMSVIGVADSFGRLRSIFGEVFSIWAVFRIFQQLYRKLLFLLGLAKINPETESIWKEAMMGTSSFKTAEGQQSVKPWSKILFWCIILCVFSLFQLLSRIFPAKEPWNPQLNPGSLAVGMYDFHASNSEELSFAANQKLMIAPEKFQSSGCQGWMLACNENNKVGLIPGNYIGLVMQSEKTGKTYIEHNGQKFQPVSSFEESCSKKNTEGTPSTSEAAEETLPKSDNAPENDNV